MSTSPSVAIMVGGKRFVPSTKTTFEQDMYVANLVSKAKLDELTQDFANNFEQTDLSGKAQQLVMQAYNSGQLFHLLSGVLSGPDGIAWSPAQAKENAEFFANLTEEQDKQALHGSIVGAILGFFVSALTSSKTSRKFSSAPVVSADPDVHVETSSIEEHITSVSGTALSEPSAITTQSASPTS